MKMTTIANIFLFVIITIILLILVYIESFLIIELPRRIGRLKFYLVLVCYIFTIAFLVFLLSLNYLNLQLFVMLIIGINLTGIWFLKNEFKKELKEDVGRIKKIFNYFKKLFQKIKR